MKSDSQLSNTSSTRYHNNNKNSINDLFMVTSGSENGSPTTILTQQKRHKSITTSLNNDARFRQSSLTNSNLLQDRIIQEGSSHLQPPILPSQLQTNKSKIKRNNSISNRRLSNNLESIDNEIKDNNTTVQRKRVSIVTLEMDKQNPFQQHFYNIKDNHNKHNSNNNRNEDSIVNYNSDSNSKHIAAQSRSNSIENKLTINKDSEENDKIIKKEKKKSTSTSSKNRNSNHKSKSKNNIDHYDYFNEPVKLKYYYELIKNRNLNLVDEFDVKYTNWPQKTKLMTKISENEESNNNKNTNKDIKHQMETNDKLLDIKETTQDNQNIIKNI
jgi:hypothetical protein